MKKGDKVHWNFAKSEAEGKIEEKFDEPVSKKIKGSTIKRNATKKKPAFLIKQTNGSKVLKSATEIKKGPKDK